MLDALDRRTRLGIGAAFAVAVLVSFAAGAVAPVGDTPSGAVAADTDGASTAEIRDTVQSFMDQQLQRQRQQLQLMASQSPNISAEDLSMDATVSSVEQSQFGSLYRVTVSVTGQVPARTGGLQQIDQDQTLYLSADGRYLFREPTDLEQQRQQPSLGGGQAPSGGQ